MRRKHRRVRQSWTGCICPTGANKIATPRVTRGWACTKATAKGPRFVKAVCGAEPAQAREQAALVDAAPKKPKPRKPKRKVDWSKCACPTGSELRVNKKGGKACYAQSKGRYVAASCS